ncbi:MAG: TIGR03905 family TSCPD domain-containing protein [Coriobacteriales bacterium]|jgi:uncharacterized protein (TIGR03905 family)|nr:TIGR03905 family TSCPD domain-containing protein [Coriobacteriales bacterium]
MTSYTPSDVCSTQIDFDLDESGAVHNVMFTRGCAGNAEGIARLAEGRSADELIELLKGIPCGTRDTSCPDQLAKALESELAAQS